MKTYIDIGVVRIQRYLAKPRHLRTQRGGSALIKFATSKISAEDKKLLDTNSTIDKVMLDPVAHYCTCLADEGLIGWQRNEEAGDIAGVVSIVNQDSIDGDNCHRVIELLARYLREKLPNAELEAYYITSESSYLESYEAMRVNGPCLVALPLENDYPGLLHCDECGATPVVRMEIFPDPDNQQQSEERRMCSDCSKREDDYGRVRELIERKKDPIAPTFLVEGKLQQEITQHRNKPGTELVDVAKSFSHLADLQQGADRANHLATIWIDGDAIGEKFKHIATTERAGAVDKLSCATERALMEAAKSIDLDESTGKAKHLEVPVIPHVLGGDDVLVTLLATEAWKFVLEFLKVFETETASLIPGTTASAAIVFARQSFPFAAQLDRAEELLAKTKRKAVAVRRKPDALQTSFVGWVDLTRETSVDMPEFFDSSKDIKNAEGIFQELNGVGGLSATQREAWIRILNSQDAEDALDRIYSDARRMGKLALLRKVFLNENQIETDEEVKAEREAKTLLKRLEILRWWN